MFFFASCPQFPHKNGMVGKIAIFCAMLLLRYRCEKGFFSRRNKKRETDEACGTAWSLSEERE
jgi:hypothetical protein